VKFYAKRHISVRHHLIIIVEFYATALFLISFTAMKQFWKLIPVFFRKMNTPYHLTIVNEETMQESLQMPLTKRSLFVFLSTLFVGIFLIFALLIFATPLKYYLPGYTVDGNRRNILKLKHTTDSLIQLNISREKYLQNIVSIIDPQSSIVLDTNLLSESAIKSAQMQENASIKSANALRKTLPPPPNDSTIAAIDSLKKLKTK
jgi:hypothetical protein